MIKKNNDIRLKAKGSGVSLWQIAKELNISEATLTRMLRVKLDKEKKDQIIKLIRKLGVNNNVKNEDD